MQSDADRTLRTNHFLEGVKELSILKVVLSFIYVGGHLYEQLI